MMNDIYMKKLFIEFCNAMEIDIYKKDINLDEYFKKHESEFMEWIKLMQLIKEEYVNLLLYMKDASNLMAELGKGKYDTVVPNLVNKGQNAIAITSFANTLKTEDIISYPGRIVELEGKPIIRYPFPGLQTGEANINPTYNTCIDTLLFQLPNTLNFVNIDTLIASSREYNDVLIGAYGNTSDKDYRKKLKELKRIREEIERQLGVSCYLEQIEENGIYLTAILSDQMKKENIKTLHR